MTTMMVINDENLDSVNLRRALRKYPFGLGIYKLYSGKASDHQKSNVQSVANYKYWECAWISGKCIACKYAEA